LPAFKVNRSGLQIAPRVAFNFHGNPLIDEIDANVLTRGCPLICDGRNNTQATVILFDLRTNLAPERDANSLSCKRSQVLGKPGRDDFLPAP
jgi:hypothetical protein